MLLSEILKGTGAKSPDADIDINGISFKPSETKSGDLFVCLHEAGAEKECGEAVARGAKAILAPVAAECGVPCAAVEDIRRAFAIASGNFCGNPAKKLKIVTVVGTDGKSTTAYLIHCILERCGMRSALIGTMYNECGGVRSAANLTTPDPPELHSLFARFAAEGAEYVVMELSAHAIYYRKLAGVRAEAAVFTNLGRDHLDFFGDEDIYRRTKKSWFDFANCKCAVVNADDRCGAEIIAEGKVPTISYGLDCPCDAFAVNCERTPRGTSFVVNMMDELIYADTRLFGRFNVLNCLAACCAARLMGASIEGIELALAQTEPPPGRYNVISRGGVDFIIDFAHTPDGLENILTEARRGTRGRLICVFGCGGDRDRGKRPQMGAVAARLADEVIVTSDNPRFEDRAAIAEDIVAGIPQGADVTVILDRATAIKSAVARAKCGDAVVIAGKGSENYIDELGVKVEYDDFSALEAALEERRRAG